MPSPTDWPATFLIAAFVHHRGIFAVTAGKGTFEFFQWGVLALYILYAVRELGLSAPEIGLISMLSSLGVC